MAKNALNNTILYGIGSLIKACASFFLLPLYTSILGATQYGQLNVLQTTSIIISTIITLALERSIYRLYHDYKTEEGKVQFISTVFIAINCIGLVVVLLFLVFGSYLTQYLGDVEFTTGLLPVVLYSYINALIGYCQIIMQTKQEGTKYLFVSILFVILYNVFCITLLYLYSPTYHSVVYATLLTTIVVFPVSFSIVRKQIGLFFSKVIMKEVFAYTTPLLGMILFAWILNFSDRLFLANLTNLRDVGLYSFAAKIVSIVPLFCGAIFQSYTPYFFNIANTMEEKQAKKKLKPINDTITFLICLICIGMAFAYNFFLRIFISDEYLSSIDFFYFLLIGALIGQQTGILNVMLYQNKKTSRLASVSITSGVLSVILNFILITTIGRIGAAISNLIVSSFLVSVTYILARKEYFIPFNFLHLACGIGAIVLMSGCDHFISDIVLQTTIKIIIVLTILFLIYKAKMFDFFVLKMIATGALNKVKCIIIKK